MKFKCLLPLLVACTALADEAKPANPEIAKIDARLAELAQFWREDTGIINRLTNFKRTPVQQGSQAYYQCLEASNRIKQAEAEAATLKAQKAALERGESPETVKQMVAKDDPFAVRPEEARKAAIQNQKDQAEAEAHKQKTINKVDAIIAKEDRESEKADSELKALNVPEVQYAKPTHGPKVKEFFIGMNWIQFHAAAKKITNDCDFKVRILSQKLNNGKFQIGYGEELERGNDWSMLGTNSKFLTATMDETGHLIYLNIKSDLSKKSFKAVDIDEREFASRFSDAYGVSFEAKYVMPDHGLPGYTRYEGASPEGVAFEIVHFNIEMKKTASEKDLKKAFD